MDIPVLWCQINLFCAIQQIKVYKQKMFNNILISMIFDFAAWIRKETITSNGNQRIEV